MTFRSGSTTRFNGYPETSIVSYHAFSFDAHKPRKTGVGGTGECQWKWRSVMIRQEKHV
jgi:hypothetical protein